MGGVGEALGRFLDTLGHLLAAFWLFKNNFVSSMGPILAPRSLSNAFWVDLGRVWGGFGGGQDSDFGRDSEGFRAFSAGSHRSLVIEPTWERFENFSQTIH